MRKTAARRKISVQKAFRWRHRFLAFLNEQKPAGLTGIVEADETQFPVSYKGQRKGMPRLAKKRSGKTRDGSGTEKTTVVVAVQRGTHIPFDQVLEHSTAVAITEALRPVLSTDAILSTDGNAAYWMVTKATQRYHCADGRLARRETETCRAGWLKTIQYAVRVFHVTKAVCKTEPSYRFIVFRDNRSCFRFYCCRFPE